MSKNLQLLLDVAETAGRIATRHFHAAPEIWDKPGNAGPVTEADLEVDRTLKAELLSSRPDYGWLSEESEDNADRLHTDKQFIIDPIDGTRAFIQKSKDWSHSIAIAQGGVVTHAVVYLPLRDEIYAAELGRGATLNGTPIAASQQTDLSETSVLAAKPNFADKNWKNGTPPVKPHFRSSLAYRLCLVASGRFDAMITLRPSWEWDIAAGGLIVSEATGTSTDRTGSELRYNNPHPQLNGVLAAGAIHPQLLSQLR
ncbi:3'(2'),5'-bisphosphate nucleotidase CysQ [Aestuariibius sp. HNIBRBA575]|uniref:3'(2'),5'-bisphosphate nucleotidase CysQ n=1 Tax=Aestuariibius sp. HNIBRBA575 TaxID=3233343 RepID=UPI0034A42BA1